MDSTNISVTSSNPATGFDAVRPPIGRRRQPMAECADALAEACAGNPAPLNEIVGTCEFELAGRTLLGRLRENKVSRWIRRTLLDAAVQSRLDHLNCLVAAAAHALGDRVGDPLLHRFVHLEFVEGVQAMLELGRDPNDVDRFGASALERALTHRPRSEARVLQIIDLLLAAGAKIANQDGMPGPLHYAACHGTPKIVERLLAAGAPMNAIDNCTKLTAVEWAYRRRNGLEVRRILLRAGPGRTGNINGA